MSVSTMLQKVRQALSPRARAEMLGDFARERALDVLAKHGLRAHWYAPTAGVEDPELADACRLLGDHGFLITGARGELVGKVATARLSSEEIAQQRRAQFRLIVDAENEQK